MRSRLSRFGAVLGLVLGLVGGHAPPAHAIVVQNVVFTGLLAMGNGMSYPCVGGKTPSPPAPPQFDPTKCPPATPNTMAWAFTGQSLSSTGKVAKAKCLLTDIACVAVTTSTIQGWGTITGNCSTWSGTGYWQKQDFDIVNTKTPGTGSSMTVNFVAIGGVNVLTGTVRRPGTPGDGEIVGIFYAQAESPTNSCWDKRPKQWIVAGGYTVVWDNN